MANPRSDARGTIHRSRWIIARRSAFETTFSRLAIDIRTETPDCWFTWGDDRASRATSSTSSLMKSGISSGGLPLSSRSSHAFWSLIAMPISRVAG